MQSGKMQAGSWGGGHNAEGSWAEKKGRIQKIAALAHMAADTVEYDVMHFCAFYYVAVHCCSS